MKVPRLVYHVAERESWERQKDSGVYRHPSLDTEGFIHCSDREAVERTRKRFFSDRTGLVLLEIDTGRLAPELRYEEGEPGVLFPHVYGPLNVDAISSITSL